MKLFSFYCLLILIVGPPGQAQEKSDPCANAQSQAEMNICTGKKYQAADAVLNQVYKQLASMLTDDEKIQLKDAENAWLKYRDANCDFAADQYKGGSIRPTIHALCLADMTRNRTTELKSQIKERSN